MISHHIIFDCVLYCCNVSGYFSIIYRSIFDYVLTNSMSLDCFRVDDVEHFCILYIILDRMVL